MIINIAIGSLMILLTTIIHSEGMMLAIRSTRAHMKRDVSPRKSTYLIALIILIMFLTTIVEIACWAVVFLFTGAIKGLEPTLYFTAVTYTSLGYGDIVLDSSRRILGAFAAANGILMFGWSTALIVAALQSIYRKD